MGKFTPNPTKFQTQKQLIRDAVAAAREKAISYMQSTGKTYADHAATLRSWSARKKKQQKPGTGIPDYTYNEEESL